MVELGMGMAMGQQVAKSMNDMMESIRRPPELQVTNQPLHAQQPVAGGSVPQPVYRPYAAGQIAPQQVSQSPQAVGQVLSQQNAASTQTPPPLPQPEVFYVSLETGKQTGPLSGTQIARLVMERKVTSETPVWKNGMTEWKTAAEVEEVASLIKLLPPQQNQGDKK